MDWNWSEAQKSWNKVSVVALVIVRSVQLINISNELKVFLIIVALQIFALIGGEEKLADTVELINELEKLTIKLNDDGVNR